MKLRFRTLCLLALVLCADLWSQDVVHLKNGARLEGRVSAENETTITLQIGDGSVDLQKSLIDRVIRGKGDPVKEKRRALMTLSRIPDSETWHFLYRKGRRVGYRHIQVGREVVDGIPGYQLTDRIVFLVDPGQGPEAEWLTKEFVDAEQRPLHVATRRSSGTSAWDMEGRRKGDRLLVVEHAAGKTRRRTALFRDDVVLWGMHLRRIAREPEPEDGYERLTIFDPVRTSFEVVDLHRRLERVNVRGEAMDVLIFTRSAEGTSLETWVDMAGKVVREEIATPYLVSLRARKDEVLAYIRGDGKTGDDDLGLEFFSEETGFRILRPDTAWEMNVPVQSRHRLVSFLRPSLRATVDVFRIVTRRENETLEGHALALFARMEDGCRAFDAQGPFPAAVGDLQGLRFRVKARRRSAEITTLGAMVKRDDRVFAILCAAPTERYEEALPAFKQILDSVRIRSLVEDVRPLSLDPFEGIPEAPEPPEAEEEGGDG